MDLERQVASHYGQKGLERTILEALSASGKEAEKLSTADLSAVDEFHLGWHAATIELAKGVGLVPAMHVLDVGCGIGGPARYFAEAHGCRVTGIDLTQEFVETAEALTRRCGLAARVSFRQASALALPFDAGTFDAATLIHVGMNIGNKAGVFTEIGRVLKPSGRFGIYDIMRMGEGELPYPMPWAATPDTSFVEPPESYRRALAHAGFEIEKEQSRRDLALTLGREMRGNVEKGVAPRMGLHLLMGSGGAGAAWERDDDAGTRRHCAHRDNRAQALTAQQES